MIYFFEREGSLGGVLIAFIRVFLIILCCLLPGGVFAGSLINAGLISPDNVNLSIRDFLGF
ncbi:hypothetical protein MJM43_32150, partial [Salmonella enterica subsp. enterica serovar Montevideo]|nr:hypothetical protein [Salmonella enterica subsp. enterica serovar Montevideo]